MMIVLATLIVILAGAGTLLYWIIGRQRYGQSNAGAMLQLGSTAEALKGNALRPEPCRTVRVYFIKPSRYDEEGYVQYFRYGVQPNNTLTVLTALNAAFNKRYAVERNVR